MKDYEVRSREFNRDTYGDPILISKEERELWADQIEAPIENPFRKGEEGQMLFCFHQRMRQAEKRHRRITDRWEANEKLRNKPQKYFWIPPICRFFRKLFRG